MIESNMTSPLVLLARLSRAPGCYDEKTLQFDLKAARNLLGFTETALTTAPGRASNHRLLSIASARQAERDGWGRDNFGTGAESR
jgi:hypothetical protein